MPVVEPGNDSTFLSPLRVEKIGPQRWLLTDDLRYRSASLRGTFVAPRGFQTDFASIPRFAQAVFPKVDRYDAAAVIHDGGYGNALCTESGQRIHLIKPLCDRLFLEACLALGVSRFRAGLMYRTVSLFGDHDGHPLALNRPQERYA